MHKIWIRNTRRDTKIHSEKEWQIVTRTSIGKSVTDYNDITKGPTLTKTGTNELAINRTESPDMAKYDFNVRLGSLRLKTPDNYYFDKLFGISIKSLQNKQSIKTPSGKLQMNTSDKNVLSKDNWKQIKCLDDIRRELEEEKCRLKKFSSDTKDQSSKNFDGPDYIICPRLRRVCWDIIRYGSLLGIFFGILFVIIWYMMKKSGGADQ